jgi:carboxylesterase
MTRILAGGEPFFFPAGTTGCLLLHGFTASPQEVHELGRHLSSRGYSALGPRLFGHATRPQDLLRARWTDWLASAADGFHWLEGICRRIVVMGVSLGGVLAFHLAAEHEVAGVVGMGTPFAVPPDPRLRLLRLVSPFIRIVPKGPPDWRDPSAADTRVAYRVYPVPGLAEVERAIRAMRPKLAHVRAPVLLMHALEETFVPPSNMEAIYGGLPEGDKQMLPIGHSSHVLTLDASRRQVFEAAADFVIRVAG